MIIPAKLLPVINLFMTAIDIVAKGFLLLVIIHAFRKVNKKYRKLSLSKQIGDND